ncbi:DUF1045 domain-containing protein [Rhizobiaceae bacterium n13]|uniref:DUF1045 domain-containing protein n=1 Tax=Ferirhizobium litorale TaxID=2927786 RepID=A0AAE3QI67_9HYPH|nr:DUF1045 domain-containing protein [Fererhizobium litorale]MDI7862889.1 DUF1045 domain-containing protein [Fererhizobium litorale]MDI7923975.1 DUF1045 domain-containing protein [Fererhizobium litorale]
MRYAIYFSPPVDDPLTVAAAQWLGRDAFSGRDFTAGDGSDDLVREPRRYGFHATIKAPFELRGGANEATLVDAFDSFVTKATPFEVPRVVLGQLGPFYALVPHALCPELQDFAAEVVRHFSPFRAPLSEADLVRRNPEKLGESQRRNLMQWGYPYVMGDFRFHMTLTSPVAPEKSPEVRRALEDHFADHIDRPLPISGLALFVEETRGAPFTVHRWLPLGLA